MEQKKTLVLGASLDSSKYSYRAIINLLRNKFPVVAVGRKSGKIMDVVVETEKVMFDDIHTITIYLSEENQKEYYDYIFDLEPQRLIFNPGTFNKELFRLAENKGIEVTQRCTIHMINGDEF